MLHANDSTSVKTQAWKAYNSWNRRDEAMAILWVRKLIDWLKESRVREGWQSALDFGCGYFDVGLGVGSELRRIDGFDISPDACEVARARLDPLHWAATIYQDRQEIPPKAYDLIIVSSVIQYFGDEETLREHLHLWRQCLTPHPKATVVIADILPQNYRPWRDALRSLEVASRHGLLAPMILHLWKSATKPADLSLFRIDLERLSPLARAAGFESEVLAANLTPSEERYSVILRPAL